MRYFVLLIVLFLFTACKKDDWSTPVASCSFNEPYNPSHSKAAALQAVMDKYVQMGIPGISIAVYTNEGFWVGTSGYAKIEDGTHMQPCHLQYAQSVSKTYLSVAILRLYEKGLIHPDHKITEYLPATISAMIKGADKITVRMLMNHTSGIPEYNAVPKYVTYLLQHPLHRFSTMDYLKFIEGKPLKFEPGTSYSYTNTNYELLALLADHVCGDHAALIRSQVLLPSGATHAYYHENADYLQKSEVVNSYWDRYSNGTIENCTEMQKVNVGSLIGDDGMIATPYDHVLFMKALFNGQLIANTTMEQMLTFVQDPKEENNAYGLGIGKRIYKGEVVYEHTGGGIGGACSLAHIKGKNAYIFIGINIGTSVSSPILEKADHITEDFYDVLMQ